MSFLSSAIFVHRYANTKAPSPSAEGRGDEMGVLIKFKEGVLSPFSLQHTTDEIKSPALKSIFEDYGIASMSCVFKNRYDKTGKLKGSLATQNTHHLERWQHVLFPSKEKARQFLAMIKNHSEIELSQLNEPFEVKPSAVPNDPSYLNNSQWHLNDPVLNHDIDAPQAWDINKGRNDVVVAILDGGVDYNHRDLDPGNRSHVITGTDTGDGDTDPLDDLPYNDPLSFAGHGTSVAGIVGAITNNNNLVAGIMWNCKIMPVKMVGNGSLTISYPFGSTVINYSTTAFPGDVANAIDYAVNNGAHVINLSYGFHGIGFPLNDIVLRMPLLFQTLNNAYLNNVVTCAAMGNEYLTDNSTTYPAGFSEQVIPVGATDQTGARASFSNTGPHISIAAPGVSVLTTMRGGSTRYFSGTSAASPVAAGVAGLVISQGKDRSFNLTNDDVKHILEITAVDVPNTGIGFDNETGYGIVNANNALQLLAPPNVLYHYTSTGGTATKVATLDKWEILDGRWNLAAALYLSVDQYKITKHITFPVAFCSPPKVWMRERESKSLDYGNPNLGRPKSFITNVTTTGFDLEYVAYYVRYNVLGQTLNQWVPVAPASTVVAYTVVGPPNLGALVGPISGPSLICSSASFTATNNPNNFPVSWTSSNPSGLSINSSGVATRVNNFNGTATISAIVTGNCGAAPAITQSVMVGSPTPGAISIDASSCPEYYFDATYVPNATSYFWQWSKDPYGTLRTKTTPSTLSGKITLVDGSGNYRIGVKANNACGASDFTVQTFVMNCAGSPKLAINAFPNPTAATLSVQVIDSLSNVQQESALAEPYELSITDRYSHKVYSAKSSEHTLNIETEGLTSDVYYLTVHYKGAVLRRQIIIRK